MEHFAFIKRQISLAIFFKAIPAKRPARFFQVLPAPEQPGVICHVEKALPQFYLPGIFVPLANQYRHTAIYGPAQYQILSLPENGTGHGIGIDEFKIGG